MCTVTITSVTGVEEDGGLVTVLEVTGTAAECEKVCVLAKQSGFGLNVTTPELQVEVDNGHWTARFEQANGDFDPGDFRCGRGNKGSAEAHCCAKPECKDSFKIEDLPCNGCPIIGPLDVSVSDTCVGGQRTVTVTAQVSPGSDGQAVVQILAGDADGPAVVVTAPDTTVSGELQLSAGEHEVRIAVVLPASCAGSDPVSVDVPPCETGFVCPSVEIDHQVGATCDNRGRRSVTATAQLDLGAQATLAARMVRVDGQGNELEQLASGSSPTGQLTLTATRQLNGGQTIFLRVEVTTPTGCGPTTADVEIQSCDACPTIEPHVAMGTTCDGAGRRRVTVSVDVQGDAGHAVAARLFHSFAGDETQRDTGTDPNGSLTLGDDQMLAAGQHHFRVEVTQPPGCPGSDFPVTVPPCGGAQPPADQPESLSCLVLEILGFLLFFAGMATMIGGGCVGSGAIALAGAIAMNIGGILLVIWAFACAGCNALTRLLIGLSIFFVLLVLVGSILLALGPIGLFAGLAFLSAAIAVAGLALGFFWAFATKCRGG
jgi:hypothetical protein